MSEISITAVDEIINPFGRIYYTVEICFSSNIQCDDCTLFLTCDYHGEISDIQQLVQTIVYPFYYITNNAKRLLLLQRLKSYDTRVIIQSVTFNTDISLVTNKKYVDLYEELYTCPRQNYSISDLFFRFMRSGFR